MYSKIEEQARRLAETAKDGVLKLNGRVYTFEFDQKHWVYNVFKKCGNKETGVQNTGAGRFLSDKKK